MEDKEWHFRLSPPAHEGKTILSDLQGAWIVLRDSVASSARFRGAIVCFFTSTGHDWETVRNLRLMPPLLLDHS